MNTAHPLSRSVLAHVAATLAVLLLGAWSPAALADKAAVYTSLFSSQALKGFDAVSYHVDGAPAKGNKAHSYEWNGATWLFASSENRERFVADPERYAPQYGGYCAWAVSQGYTASGDPTVWAIEDGKLYLNYNEKVGETWNQDRAGFIQQANENWPAVLKK